VMDGGHVRQYTRVEYRSNDARNIVKMYSKTIWKDDIVFNNGNTFIKLNRKTKEFNSCICLFNKETKKYIYEYDSISKQKIIKLFYSFQNLFNSLYKCFTEQEKKNKKK
jgi:hypothetical protein